MWFPFANALCGPSVHDLALPLYELWIQVAILHSREKGGDLSASKEFQFSLSFGLLTVNVPLFPSGS
ncbi:hypothetical protein EC9_04940 [Rosistilla ulvae]|uniref:Uncharacterized protein n=1 Tax=Rosistilla ulvae TaxID=1930277 RepID=A0A517LUP2_9BACT|nr:hypothetical protein EC9_04940 [Rosistilla ulvae]